MKGEPMNDCYYMSKYTGAQIDAAIGAVLEGRAVLVTNCPNCGAPIEGGKCPYCGTKFLKYEKDGDGE